MKFLARGSNALFKPLVAGFILILLVISGCGQDTQNSFQPVQQSTPSAQKLPKETIPAELKPPASMVPTINPQQMTTQPLDIQPPPPAQSTPALPPRTQPPQEATFPPPTGQEPPAHTPPPPPAVAPLKITTRSEIPGGNQRAVDSFLQTYPYLVKYLGEPFSIVAEGVNWEYDAKAAEWGFNAKTNTVCLNANILMQAPDQPPYAKLDESYQHETTHLFYDVGDDTIRFSFGQWIWEAHALAGQALADQDALGLPAFESVVANYDAQASIGYEVLNGVPRDGEKWNRSIVDNNATNGLLLLTDVLSSSSERDFLKRVNAGILARYRATKNLDISPETYRAILNEAAAGKKIDGQSPGDWLFAQPVANIAGKTGNYLAVVPLYSGALHGMDLFPTRFWIFAFQREKPGQDYQETALIGLNVRLTVYDAGGKVIAQTTVRTTGGIGYELDCWQLLPRDIRDGAYIIKAETEFGGNKLEACNYFTIMRQAPKITVKDDRLIVMMINASGNALVREMPADMTITGGQVQSTLPGIVVITAAPGAEVTFKLGNFEKISSKPITARVVPLRLP